MSKNPSVKYFLAIDIGASSGRHILSHIEDGKMLIEEIYRFDNKTELRDGHLAWNISQLSDEVKKGIKKCREAQKIPVTIGIDSWGVDYVLLDDHDNVLMPVFAYRDSRTEPFIAEVEKRVSSQRLYEITGTQKQSFNTIYQLYADKVSGKMEKASSFLMIPEYLAFVLTGKKVKDFTNASTTGLLDVSKHSWSAEILDKLGFKKELFPEVTQPGTLIGKFSLAVKTEIGFDAKVVMVATHDTASAIVAIPSLDESIYLSSGTWSLMGVELFQPILSEKSWRLNFTNEGAYPLKVRYLKNIMGLWMLQKLRKEVSEEYARVVTFPELISLAMSSNYQQTLDVNDYRFLNPDSMIKAVKTYFDDKPPIELKDVLACVYRSLAISYRDTAQEIEDLAGKHYKAVYIIGGGSQDMFLNELTKTYTGKRVFYGPTEATAIGNILVQMIYEKDVNGLNAARLLVQKSFDVKEV